MNIVMQSTTTIQQERFSDVIEEVQPLLERHWEEVALYKDIIPLSPNYARYSEMEAKGRLCVVTARVEGELIGYVCFIVDTSLHYSTIKWAVSDVIWVAPEHRGAQLGNSLMQSAEAALLNQGVVIVHVVSKAAHPTLSALLVHRGYSVTEKIHAKVLQRPE